MEGTGLSHTANDKPSNIAAVSLVELGTSTLKAVACPTDQDYLDPSDLFTATITVVSPTAAGGVGAPAEVSATLALGRGPYASPPHFSAPPEPFCGGVLTPLQAPNSSH